MLHTVWSIAAPFIAAILAALLAYHLGLRQHRHDILLAEKLASFKVLNKVLSEVAQYCEINSHPGGDLGSSLEELPDGAPRSALMHINALGHAISSHAVFISPGGRNLLHNLSESLNMAASMELICASSADIKHDKKVYESVGAAAKKCIAMLYRELRLPR